MTDIYLVFKEAFAGPGRELRGVYDSGEAAAERAVIVGAESTLSEVAIQKVEINKDIDE